MLLPRVSLRFALGYVLLPFQGVPTFKTLYLHNTKNISSQCLCASVFKLNYPSR